MDLKVFRCERIEENNLREIADTIRKEYWPEGVLPVDAEQIVELRLRLDIIPWPGLLQSSDIDAWLKSDRTGIIVDSEQYMNTKFSNRLRFSLAHELGHFFLHNEIYRKFDFQSAEEWIDFIQNVSEVEYRAFEWQANEFAGRLLVPRPRLEEEVFKAVSAIQEKGLSRYIEKDPDQALSRVTPFLRRPFGVSEDVIEKRVKREKLWPPPESIF